MKLRSRTTASFRKQRDALSPTLRKKADDAYALFSDDPSHRSLQFKKVHTTLPIYSARIDLSYRAVGVLENDIVTWFWIGPHDEYERLIRSR